MTTHGKPMMTLSFGFSSLVAVARTPKTMLSKSGECWHVVIILFLSSDLQLLWYRLRDVKSIADLLYGASLSHVSRIWSILTKASDAQKGHDLGAFLL